MPAPALDLLGPVLLILLVLLTGYLGILRVREFLAEKPDPKLTYATRSELEKTRSRIEELQSANKADLERHRREHAREHRDLDRRLAAEAAGTHGLIQKNAEHIAAILAQNQSLAQRLHELTIKTDKLLERTPCHAPS